MHHRQQTHSDENHRPLKHHEEGLRICDAAVEPILQLRDTEAAADEDKEGGEPEGAFEEVEALATSKVVEAGAARTVATVDVEVEVAG